MLTIRCNALVTTCALSAAAVGAYAQPSPLLLEACNAVSDAAKRLACLQDFVKLQPSPSRAPQEQGLKYLEDLRRAFASTQGAVAARLSYVQYQTLSLEPAKALSVFRSANPTALAPALDFLQQAADAYSDAQVVWRASIYDSQDAGIFGRVLNPSRAGLEQIVYRYSLRTESVLFQQHLPASAALADIWRRASSLADRGLSALDGAGKGEVPTGDRLEPVESPRDTTRFAGVREAGDRSVRALLGNPPVVDYRALSVSEDSTGMVMFLCGEVSWRRNDDAQSAQYRRFVTRTDVGFEAIEGVTADFAEKWTQCGRKVFTW
jgi:hypothetical protein